MYDREKNVETSFIKGYEAWSNNGICGTSRGDYGRELHSGESYIDGKLETPEMN